MKAEVKEPMAYLGIKPCGCFGFAAVDEPRVIQDSMFIKDIKWILSIGGKVERVSCESVRKYKFYCSQHEPNPNQPKLIP